MDSGEGYEDDEDNQHDNNHNSDNDDKHDDGKQSENKDNGIGNNENENDGDGASPTQHMPARKNSSDKEIPLVNSPRESVCESEGDPPTRGDKFAEKTETKKGEQSAWNPKGSEAGTSLE
ncbi:MAG: hypothetical protein M1834_007977 [Cirrosporium novae-zelandiae]|nr:MAG: hypothetical protein M1834_007977 [Cirrosporium novae-zelandiae]